MQKDPPTHCGGLLSKPTSTLLFQTDSCGRQRAAGHPWILRCTTISVLSCLGVSCFNRMGLIQMRYKSQVKCKSVLCSGGRGWNTARPTLTPPLSFGNMKQGSFSMQNITWSNIWQRFELFCAVSPDSRGAALNKPLWHSKTPALRLWEIVLFCLTLARILPYAWQITSCRVQSSYLRCLLWR